MVDSVDSLKSPSSSSMRGKEIVVEETKGNIDLNLSLSLNGKFGVDPHKNGKVIRSSFQSKVSMAPVKRNGGEIKTLQFFPTKTDAKEMGMGMGRRELHSVALMDANQRRSLDSTGSSTISYFQNQTIEGQGFPANIGCVVDKKQGNSGEVFSSSSSFSVVEEVKGRVFNKVADMPNVFTTISGQKIKGFLAKYNQEGIDIICACHGFSMTPAEFIKHGGGGDVANPERHIIIKCVVDGGEVVNPPN